MEKILITTHQNSSDLSPVKVLRYTVIYFLLFIFEKIVKVSGLYLNFMVLQNHKSKLHMWKTPFCKSDHKCYFMSSMCYMISVAK